MMQLTNILDLLFFLKKKSLGLVFCKILGVSPNTSPSNILVPKLLKISDFSPLGQMPHRKRC